MFASMFALAFIVTLCTVGLAYACSSFATFVRSMLVLVLVLSGLSVGATVVAHALDFRARAAARLADIDRMTR